MEYSVLLKKISNYCVTRERSEKEIEEKLLSWNTDYNDIVKIIELLKKENLLNKKRYIADFVNDKIRNQHWGKNKIFQYLEFQNINTEDIEDALKEISEEDYKNIAVNLIQKSKNSKTVYFNMINKGFEENLVLEIIKELGITEIY